MMTIICFLIVMVLAKILTTVTAPEGPFQNAAEGILFSNFWLLLFILIILPARNRRACCSSRSSIPSEG